MKWPHMSSSVRVDKKAGVNSAAALCTMSMTGMSEVDSMVFKLKYAGRTAEDKKIFRDMVVLHEMGHCEVTAGTVLSFNTGQDNRLSLAQRYFRSFNTNAVPAYSESLETLALERHADARALLVAANWSLSKASSPAEIREGLRLFDRHVNAMLELRGVERIASGGHFNDHDTFDLTHLIKGKVHLAAQSEESFSRFKNDFLNPENVSEIAMQMAVQSMRDEAQTLHVKLVSEEIGNVKKKMAMESAFIASTRAELEGVEKTLASGRLAIGPVLEPADVVNYKFIKERVEESLRGYENSQSILQSDLTYLEAMGLQKAQDFWPPERLVAPIVAEIELGPSKTHGVSNSPSVVNDAAVAYAALVEAYRLSRKADPQGQGAGRQRVSEQGHEGPYFSPSP